MDATDLSVIREVGRNGEGQQMVALPQDERSHRERAGGRNGPHTLHQGLKE